LLFRSQLTDHVYRRRRQSIYKHPGITISQNLFRPVKHSDHILCSGRPSHTVLTIVIPLVSYGGHASAANSSFSIL